MELLILHPFASSGLSAFFLSRRLVRIPAIVWTAFLTAGLFLVIVVILAQWGNEEAQAVIAMPLGGVSSEERPLKAVEGKASDGSKVLFALIKL